MAKRDYYEVLGIDKSADKETINSLLGFINSNKDKKIIRKG